MLDPFKEDSNVQLLISFFSRLINLNAVTPVGLVATKCLNPVVDGIFYIKPEVEVFLSDSFAIVAVVKSSFCHHQLISILVKRHHEETHERN